MLTQFLLIMKYYLLLLTCVLLLFAGITACKHNPYTTEKLPEKQIRWGSGGGIAGKESAHILCENGQVFYRDILGKVSSAPKTKAKKALALFKTVEALEMSKIDFTHPGNTYQFFEWQDGDIVSRVVWGDKGFPVDKSLSDLYGSLNLLLQK